MSRFIELNSRSDKSWIRLTNRENLHRGVKFMKGKVKDHEIWNTDRECCKGGLYLCQRADILHWMNYLGEPMVWAWDVTIPDYAKVKHYRFQSKADCIILSNCRPIADVITEMTESELISAVRLDRNAIQYITNPTESVQMSSVASNPSSIQWIANPTNSVRLLSEAA